MAAIVVTGCAGVTTSSVEERLQNLAFQPNMYIVQAGDTVDTIAFRYKLSREELVTINPGLGQGQLLRPGERINVRPGTELSAKIREGAFLPRNADKVAAVPSPAPQQPTVITEVVAAPAVRPEPVAAQQDIIITEAAYDSVTGGHPNEEVIADDLDFPAPAPLPAPATVAAPATGYIPVPAADNAARIAAQDNALSPGWVWPTDGAVARGFAPERIGGQGVDIAGLPGQDVRAATGGTVVYSGKDPSGSGGSLVILRHDEGLMTTYSHADKLFVTEDDVVQAGDPIASLGWNEASESVLSFEVRRGGEPLDPLGFVIAR